MSEFHKYFQCPICGVHNTNDNSLPHASFFMPITTLKNSLVILHQNMSRLSPQVCKAGFLYCTWDKYDYSQIQWIFIVTLSEVLIHSVYRILLGDSQIRPKSLSWIRASLSDRKSIPCFSLIFIKFQLLVFPSYHLLLLN